MEAQSRLEEIFDLLDAHPDQIFVLTKGGVPVAQMLAPSDERVKES